mmetsp:Transcript_22608/g.65147  ORF Transcript_22608/g.65147 Transcript_22608/m.65147 type:complete len:371 (-) Transcript_22608:152-1264(-)|eukprot:CAMPEP_0168368320 /NCGR_PEP_ID=MMETSP0228-20121227/6191_1 /TAXON_ID=133427 /ORGANISM="Protoceratium reticulatum, Strain CCCM 535 (=CCMP 1889)" /LENGTH=370 /DNA_ID=CAMNT_0008381165 /DNA_START=40 /DNA_END=1152 /DNA_ORIENTATION=+
MAEFELADLKIEDTNLAGIASDEDKSCRKAAAESEEAWQGCGAAPGIQIWRVEQFKVVPWPEKEHGDFYEGDSYIVLQTYQEPGSDALHRRIFFWLGLKSTADEQGTAAYKTVELDDLFDGVPSQHREVMRNESPLFKSLFGQVHYLDGGAASGFHHVQSDGGAYPARLLLVKRMDKTINVVQVPTACESLNQGDCFVLDAGATLYVWFGEQSSPFEKQAANAVAEQLEASRDGAAKATQDIGDEFWDLLGGMGDIKEASEVPVLMEPPEMGEVVLYRLAEEEDGEIRVDEVGRGELSRDMLTSDSVYLCDVGQQVLVWLGAEASDAARRQGMISATKYMKFNNRPVTTPVTVVKEGHPFSTPFDSVFAN